VVDPLVEGEIVVVFEGVAEGGQARVQPPERGEHGPAVLGENRGPKVRVAGGDAGRIAEPGRGEVAQVVGQRVRQRRRDQVRQVTGDGQGVVVVLRVHR